MPADSQNILEILKLSSVYLEKHQLPSPRLEAELIISHVLGCKRLDIYLRFDQPMKNDELEKIRVLLKRRSAHEPLQHILGNTSFYNCIFKTDRRALIPRSDTETLVEECIKIATQQPSARVLDIGTGSGCIAVTLAKNLPTQIIAAVDIDGEALALAKENALLNGVEDRIIFAAADILKPFKTKEPFDLIVSNPPYIALQEMADLDREVRDYEPHTALTDGGDGLNFYRRLAELTKEILKSGGWLLVEIGYQQAESVSAIFDKHALTEIKVLKDLSGNDRVVKARKHL